MKEEAVQLKTTFQQVILVMAVMLLVYGLDSLGWLGWPRGVMERGLSVVYQGVGTVIGWVGTPVRIAGEWRDGVTRIASLEERLAQVSVDYAKLKSLEEENEALRAVKGIKTEAGEAARILARMVKDGERASVNKGSREGVGVGMAVTDTNGVLVGVVGEVEVNRSKVIPVSSSRMRIPVRVVGETTMGVLVGDGEKAELMEVLQTEPLKEGDMLVTGGGEGEFPEGLVVGQVEKLTGSAADVTRGAEVNLLAENETIVLIIKP